MCSVPKAFFVPTHDAKRISRSKLHKYLIRERPDEKILNEICHGPACIYQPTTNGYSAMFLAIAKDKENILRKLMEIYENDHKALVENGYKNDVAVLIAFGAGDNTFVNNKLSKFISESEDESEKKFLILMKETNEAVPQVKSVSPKNEDEQKTFLEIVERLHINGTFDVNTRNSNDDTLFLAAASQGQIWVLEKLIELGAEHDVPNKQLTSPLEFACINHQFETVKWIHKKFKPDLLKFMREGFALFNIAASGDFEIFDYIMTEIKRLDGDEHVDEIFGRRTEYHDTNILMEGINKNQFDFVIKCLKYEPDLSICDSSGNNMLHALLRCWPMHYELCKILIRKQSNLLVMEDSNQWTPLHLLAMRNCLEEVKEVYEKFPAYKNTFFKNFADTPTIEKEKEQIWCQTAGHSVFSSILGEGNFVMAEFILDNHLDEFGSASHISGLVIMLAQQPNSLGFLKRLQKLKHFDINVPHEGQHFPLVTVLSQKRFDMFKYMIELCNVKDLNVMLDCHAKNNLLHYAIWNNPVHVTGMPLTECNLPCEADSSDDEANEPVKEANDVSVLEATVEQPDPEIERKTMFGIFQDLLRRGVIVNHKSNHGATLLHTAVDYNNLEVVQELLKLLPTDEIDHNGNTPLHHVKSVEVFKVIMESKPKPELLNLKNTQGRTPFMNFVSLFGHDPVPVELFSEFMKHKADINAADNDGYKPIHAVSTEQWLKLLLANGADINATNNSGENAVHIALRTHRFRFARFLLHHTEIDRFAVTADEVSYIGYVTVGNVMFHEIFDGGLRMLFDELVDKHINGKTLFGGLLINVFIHDSNLKLIQHPKADLHQAEADGQTCLHRAIIFKSNLQVVKILVDRGLDINAVNESGFTPLMFCIDYQCSDIALFLIEQSNINLNLTNVYGFTALHYAARNEDTKVLCKLLAAGADPTILNNENQTFYDLLSDFDKKLFSAYASPH